MIIKITPAEIQKLVARALSLDPSAFTVEIVNTHDCATAAALRSAIEKFPNYLTSEKISAIKHFRAAAPRTLFGDLISLADAKWAIENDHDAFRNLRTYGKLQNR